ncbi:hypothetical protein CPB97_011566 [Podila verticillata]|nr:hypothetical protein CPB97_011566 [Podila verticillata]
MPSVISPRSSHSASEIDFIPDDGLYYDHSHASHSSKGSSAPDNIKELKQQQQQQRWSDPDDEFSVPIHTESPLIAKKGPLGMSSFLLNYRTMHRSIEIMTPPSQHSTKSPSDSSTTSLHPTVPDGPFYIHHRSTKAESPLASVVSCSHVHCFQHNHHPYNVSRTGQCQDSRRLLSAAAPVAPGSSHQFQGEEPSSSTSSRSSSRNHSRTPSSSGSEGHSLLENHIASIGQWLSLNS